MRAILKRWIGADRPKIIAVLGLTRADVEAGVAHAQTAGEALPVRTWCAEDTSAFTLRRELRSTWPALILVSWTGERGDIAFKLVALTVPPFRVVVFNEARGFFAARPGPLAKHGWHRISVAMQSAVGLAKDLSLGAAKWAWSLLYRTGQRIRDIVRLAWSLLYRSGEWIVRQVHLGFALIGLAFEFVLAVLAFLAQITPAMVRSVNDRHALDQAAPVSIKPAAGSSFTEVVVHGRAGWKRGKVRRAKTDFIVFCKPGETDSCEPLIQLAIELNAFAVAKQIAWTGWRARVATKHPFRRLLPGEVAQVAMPFSSLIVMRRDLMTVPHAVTFGAALMMLFKGGLSYVAGNDRPMTQEPAMPLEDLEYVLRSRTRYQPALARGNVVWSPSHAKPFRGLPRVLIVSPYLPFPLSHGGAVRIYNICRSLKHEVDFVLVCFREVTETVRYPELHEVFREVYTVDIDEKNKDATVPKQAADYRNSAMSALIREQARRVDIVQLEFTQMAEYRACAEGKPTILVEHDVTFTLYQQLGRDYEVWQRFECEALRSVDRVWTMSEQDKALLREHGAGKTIAVPNGVDLTRFQPSTRETAGQTILFVGSFRHLPNLLAFEAMQETIMPLVWAMFPECRLHAIAGPDHEKWARSGGKGKLLVPDARITIQGFVEDVRPAYRECDAVSIPLPVSAGTNIKLMEAMACGRAIVSTPVGCQGLDLEDGVDLLVRDIGPGFAEALCALLSDGSRREQMATRARRTAEQRFDWDIIAREALTCYTELQEKP